MTTRATKELYPYTKDLLCALLHECKMEWDNPEWDAMDWEKRVFEVLVQEGWIRS